jgi:predicted amidohydrolase YtcJ
MINLKLAKLVAVAVTFGVAGAAIAAEPVAVLEADLILDNAEIYTGAGWAQALAVKNGVIVELGDAGKVAHYKGPKTKVMDLSGATVVPGMHDMHVHPMGSGLQQLQCNFPQGSSADTVIAAVKDCVARRDKGAWVTGGQWDAASFGKTAVHRALLDNAAPDNPVVLTDISGHSAWANSKALRLAGITSATKDPDGGIIERDAKGEPTGVLRESGAALVRKFIPAYTAEQNETALKWSLREMLSYGVTSFTDAGVDERTMRAYAALADKGVLKQRVRGCIGWRAMGFTAEVGPAADPIGSRNLYARDRFKPDCIKIVLDGVPTDGHTAAMLEPYADAKHPTDVRAKGLLMVAPAPLKAAVIDFDRRGLTVKFHAAGDGAMRAGIDAVEAARKANGFSGIVHDVGHASFVEKGDLRRAAASAATIEVSPYIWYPNPIIPDIQKAIGPERMKRWIPVKDAVDAGALVVPGSDWAVVPSVNPWIALETLVTRQKLGGGGEVLGAEERITLKQAFDLFTVNSALQMGNRDKTGSIEKGMLADVLVLDRNPFKIPVTQIHETKVKLVLIGGEVAHTAGIDERESH